MIQNIDIELLCPHPDNPRKDVGDVTELSESIRVSGILQNLTVVPHEGRYRVIIGHRRLAAAKKAGLSSLPCIVCDMDYKTQLATMLCENMQRVDLTVVEQVQGIQMMLDLGESVQDVAGKTGFTVKTVKQRSKLSALPADKLKTAEANGGTIEEYLKCLEFEGEVQERLLSFCGSRDFNNQYQNEVRRRKENANKEQLLKELQTKGWKELRSGEQYSCRYNHIKSFYFYDTYDFSQPVLPDGEYYFCMDVSALRIYEKAKKSAPKKKSQKEIEAEEKRRKLKDLTAQMFALRRDFILNFRQTKQYRETLMRWMMAFTARNVNYFYGLDKGIIKAAAKDDSGRYNPDEEKVKKWVRTSPDALAVLTYYISADCDTRGYYKANYGNTPPEYQEDEALDMIYAFLGELGYRMSTEEQQLMDGTHELFGGIYNDT